MRLIKAVSAALLSFVILLGSGVQAFAAGNVGSAAKAENGLEPIMGESTVTIGQMVNFYLSEAEYPSFYANTDAPNIYKFCEIYLEECQVEGVRPEIAFCQSMLETGFLQYRNCDARPEQFNFAGLDTTGRDPVTGVVNRGRSYSSVRQGIRAHVQRLKAWAVKDMTPEKYKYPCIDKDKFDSNWWRNTIIGSSPYVEWLGKEENPSGFGWATAPNYGPIIINILGRLKSASVYTTWYRGMDYSAVYNADYYLLNNPDVAGAMGNNGEAAIAHFVNYGMGEGRQASAGFHVQAYRAKYQDLRLAFGNNLKSYYMHYITNGQKEGRSATGSTVITNGITVYNGIDYKDVYNYTDYTTYNPDIARAYPNDDLAALSHFVNYGMKEGRQASKTFSVQSYRNQYADLRRAFGKDFKSYYMHYKDYGKKEGRAAVGCNTVQGATTVYGGVDYNAVYDYNYYISKNPDIKAAFGNDDVAVLSHFVNYGMKEGRVASEEFNVLAYKGAYSDLQSAFGSDLRAYFIHYMNYGKAEGRTGK